ncbi:hypothetical protein ElyMa_003004400 [Elysia marginata]|uniref:Uncharacterized protein n=1 Tax=Elysia marginata TaxID=1093978 RepID=A0AAV4IHA0_9GAST|nr:hypothetical protein ElyMa_003004400 [Elysia marginata]
MFDVRGTRMGEARKQDTGPKVTIGLGPGPKISLGISKDSSSRGTGIPSGPSATFSAQAGRKPNGAFKVRFNLNTNLGAKNKPGAYASSFANKR